MNNLVVNTDMSIGKTYQNNTNSTVLGIPKEFAKRMDIESSKVSILLVEEEEVKYLVILKLSNEILIS